MHPGSIEAYFFDEAVIFFGMNLEGMLDEAGQKQGKQERKAQAARERLLAQVMGDEENEGKVGSGFADPAAMFA